MRISAVLVNQQVTAGEAAQHLGQVQPKSGSCRPTRVGLGGAKAAMVGRFLPPLRPQGVASASGLVGVVADLGPFLFAVQGFDGGVDVQYPGGVECGLYAAQQLGHQPAAALLGTHVGQGAAQSIFADDLFTPSTCGLSASLRSPVVWA